MVFFKCTENENGWSTGKLICLISNRVSWCKALCNGHSTAVGLKDLCVALDKCNDAFRPNTFCCVHSVLNTNIVNILLISDDMTVSVRRMKRHPERRWQKYWHRRNNIGNNVCSWELVLVLCWITVSTSGFGILQGCSLVQCDKTLLLQTQQKQRSKAQRHTMLKIETTPSISHTWTTAQFFSTGKKTNPGLSLIKDPMPLHLPTSAPLRAFPKGQGLISIIFPLMLSD